MLDGFSEDPLADQLLMIARNHVLRQSVYEQLGEYCHMCRNRLNSLKLSIFLAMRLSKDTRVDRWLPIERQYLELERAVDRLQTLCRPMTLSPVSIALDLLIEDHGEAWAAQMAAGGCDLECIPPRSRAIATFDVERIGQALDAIVQWRAGGPGADRTARLRWWVDAETAHVVWDEDPTAPSGQVTEGAKWALPLVARVVQAHGGEYRLTEVPAWRLEFSWPIRPATP